MVRFNIHAKGEAAKKGNELNEGSSISNVGRMPDRTGNFSPPLFLRGRRVDAIGGGILSQSEEDVLENGDWEIEIPLRHRGSVLPVDVDIVDDRIKMVLG